MRRARVVFSVACVTVGLWVVALGACSMGTLLADSRVTRIDRGAVDWVVLVLMSADNELEAYAIDDLNEMEAAGVGSGDVVVLALLDRASGYDASNGDWDATRLYEIVDDPNDRDEGHEGDRVIRSIPLAVAELGLDPGGADATTDGGADVELNTGDPAVVKALLSFARTTYAPEHLALFFWGHGAGVQSRRISQGSSRAVGVDDTSGGDALLIQEIARALEGERVDVVGFDTSFAASIEFAWELRDHATFMVARQGIAPAGGWAYDDVLARFLASDRSPEALASAIVASYAGLADETGPIASIRLSAVAPVMDALNAFSNELHAAIEPSSLRDSVRASLFYDVQDFYTTPGDLAIDLADMADVIDRDYDLVDDEAALLRARTDDAVHRFLAASGSGPRRAHGLSVHLIPLDHEGTAAREHDPAYQRRVGADDQSAFVNDSSWPPVMPSGPGLLYRLFYEPLAD